jgi:hypothetical protein
MLYEFSRHSRVPTKANIKALLWFDLFAARLHAGDLAQMVERMVRIHEAQGSIPWISTFDLSSQPLVQTVTYEYVQYMLRWHMGKGRNSEMKNVYMGSQGSLRGLFHGFRSNLHGKVTGIDTRSSIHARADVSISGI